MLILLIVLYIFCLSFILGYSLIQLNLTIKYFKKSKIEINPKTFEDIDKEALPIVTIQLPIYNEMYVVERLLQSVIKIDYPKHKLEIQVLDDSTDATIEIVQNSVRKIKDLGFDIQILHRIDRKEYKAGALKEALNSAKGEFIAIFDADFIPKSDFLEKTILHFEDEKVGMVQTRWGHVNRNFSILTKIQAFGLDAHFTLDQGGRAFANHLISFNGTAGVWRKTCIFDAGNWDGTTLSEDLDLSYRAQFKDWKLKYLEEVESPAELPITIQALKSQQYRWNKGTAEVFQRMKSRLLKYPKISLLTKIHGFFHLLSSSVFLNVLTVSLLSIPMLFLKVSYSNYNIAFAFSSLFTISSVILFLNYWIYYSKMHGNDIRTFGVFVKEFFLFMSIITGFAFHNSLAVFEGHIGRKTPFIRTPKFNLENTENSIKTNGYMNRKVSLKEWIEGLLFLYFLLGAIAGLYFGEYALIPFHVLVSFGYGYIFYHSIWGE